MLSYQRLKACHARHSRITNESADVMPVTCTLGSLTAGTGLKNRWLLEGRVEGMEEANLYAAAKRAKEEPWLRAENEGAQSDLKKRHTIERLRVYG